MKVRLKQKMAAGAINVYPGDCVTLSYTDPFGIKHEVAREEIDRYMHLTHVVIFDVEPGDFEGAKDGIGGAFLEMES